MVVPHHDERMLAMDVLQVDVAAIKGVAASIILQRDQLCVRLYRPLDRRIVVAVAGELVNVVAKVDDGVEIGAVGEAAIDVEVSGRVIGAAHLRKT
jgi:hypothetical protein